MVGILLRRLTDGVAIASYVGGRVISKALYALRGR